MKKIDNLYVQKNGFVASLISNQLYEVAFSIHKIIKVNSSAIQVLVDRIKNLDPAYEFPERCNERRIWWHL